MPVKCFFFFNVGTILRDIYKKTPVLSSYLQSLSLEPWFSTGTCLPPGSHF